MTHQKRVRGCISFRPAVVIGLSALALLFQPCLVATGGRAYAQKQDTPTVKYTTTTTADDAYGRGGTIETTSNQNFRLVETVFRDPNGKLRELHTYEDGGEICVLYDDKGHLIGVYGVRAQGEKWVFFWTPGDWTVDKLKPKKTLEVESRQAGQKLIAETSEQFHKTGVIDGQAQKTAAADAAPEKKDDKPIEVEPPTLPPSDIVDPPPKPGGDRPLPTDPKNVIGAVPKTCGEIKDPEIFAAMGCGPGPAKNQVAGSPVATVSTEPVFDCFSDRACIREIEELGREYSGGSSRRDDLIPCFNSPECVREFGERLSSPRRDTTTPPRGDERSGAPTEGPPRGAGTFGFPGRF